MRAMKDETFRKALLSDPIPVIEQAIGLKLPHSVHVQVLEEKPDTFYLILPSPATGSSADELTETDLLTVSGGFDWSVATDCGTCGKDCQGTNP